MHPSSRGILSVLVAALCGCMGGQSGTESNGGTSESTGGQSSAGVGGGSGEGTGGQSTAGVGGGSGEGTGGSTVGGDDRCVVVSTTPVGWLDETELGTSEAVFGAVSGTCQAPFVWDGSGWGDMITVTPASGESTVTVTVEVDETSARSVERAPAPSVSSMEGMVCDPPLLEVDATVTLALTDGTSWEMPATVMITAGWQTPWIEVATLVPADLSEWVSIVPADDVSPSLYLQLSPPAEECVGEIQLQAETSDGGVVAAVSAFASWSDTGCALGERVVDLSQPLGAVDFAAEVNTAFGERELPGVWEDGGATTLTLGTTLTATQVCASVFYAGDIPAWLEIPAQVVASTADERLVGLDTPGTVRATMNTNGSLNSLQLGTGTTLVCETATDVLPYRTADCAEVQSVDVGLGLNVYLDDSAPDDEGDLELYITLRNSTAPPGAADRVDRLVLEP